MIASDYMAFCVIREKKGILQTGTPLGLPNKATVQCKESEIIWYKRTIQMLYSFVREKLN